MARTPWSGTSTVAFHTSSWLRNDRARRRLAATAILLFLLSLLVQYASFSGAGTVPTVIAAHDEGIFELDGDALDDTDPDFANDADWEDGPEGAADAFFVGEAAEAEANDNTYLQTGNSKDENDVSSWVISTTGAPDKNELLDAYAAVYQKNGETWVYFGADRFDNDGTAQIGFWFFQNDLGISNGAFTGGHEDGDVLIISEYTNGGVVSTICAYTWDSDGGGDNASNAAGCDQATKNSNLNLVAAGAQCDIADGTYDICAVSNGVVTTAPWPFTNKDNKHDFGKGQFFEGGMNLSDMFGGNAPCFGTFLAETRTSAETDAQLKDIAFGDFDTCVPPTITTLSSASTRDFGQTVSDTATFTGANGAVTGTADFFICTPTQVTAGGCEGSAGTKVGATKTINAGGTATSDGYTVGLTAAAAGKYCWRVEYEPDDDANYQAGSHTNATTECFTVAPATIDIDKVANPVGPVMVGSQVGFDIVVRNNGSGTALGVSVTDSLPGGIVWTADAPTGNTSGVSCSINTAPNPDVLTCSDSNGMAKDETFTVHIHGATDAGDCGTVNNSATVTTTNDGSDTDPASVFVSCPALQIDKTDNGATYDSVGDVITYSITVTNAGNVTLTNVLVTDPNANNVDCAAAAGLQNVIPSLAAGASVDCSASHAVTQADIDAGNYHNVACADDGNGDGDNTGAESVCDDEDTPGVKNPALSIVKDDNAATYDSVGDVITYSITVTNTGNVTLANVVVTDALAVGLDCSADPGNQTTIASLAPGAVISCSATHTVTQADLDAGSYLNTACADDGNGDGDTGAKAVCDDEETPGLRNPALSIVKDDNGATFDSVGDVINYTIVVTNTGNVTLANVVVTDALAVGLDCSADAGIQTTIASLAPGAVVNCTASHTVTQADIDAGTYLNTACADDGNGDGDDTGAKAVCDDEDTPGERKPALSIDKVDDTGTYDSVGDVISYSITVTNTGNVTLTNVVVTDPNAAGLDCLPAPGNQTSIPSMAPGAFVTCTASHIVTQADLDAGSYFNQACADDGNGDGDTGAKAVCDDVTTPGAQSPSLIIDKVDDTGTYDSVGDVISYSITVTNNGNVTLTNVVVSDAQVSDLVCVPASPVASLAPGGVITCTASHTVIQADIDAGSFFNQACADDGSGDGDPGADKVCDDVTTPGVQNPSLIIDKVDNTGTYDSVGDVISYSITVTNNGNVTLLNVVVTDAQVADLDCTPASPVASLAPGGVVTCTASHIVTQADLDAGSYFNQACADDGNGDGDTGADKVCDDVTTPGVQSPALSIVKADGDATYDSVGDVINYTIVATNTGNVTLHDVVVTDPNAAGLVCVPATPVASLAPGGVINCTASHTVTQADIDAGSYLNTACVDDGSGDGDAGADEACDSEDTPGVRNPALAIVKVDHEDSFDSVGDVITYTITATNTGNVTLHDVVVTDAQVSNLDCTPDTPVADLAPGGQIVCTASHTVTQADVDAGTFLNTACADDGNGDGEAGADAVCDNEDTPGVQNPALAIVKTDNDATYDSVGDVINYSITATNTGNVTLHDVVVTDPKVSDLECNPDLPVADLAPGGTITCTASHTVTQEDIDAGSFLNTACVDDGNGDGDAGADEACDEESTPGTKNPALSIVKTDGDATYDAVGDVINYTITATNTGNVTLHNVVVTDPNVNNLVCLPATPVADLAPGAQIVCVASHTVVQADLDNGSYRNSACVNDGDEGAAEACDDEDTPGEPKPALAIVKSDGDASYDSVGDLINYTITATNTGNVTLHDVVVTDPKVSNLVCLPATPVADLAPGGQIVCTASHSVTQEDLDNGSYLNTACVDDGNGDGDTGAHEACDDEDTPGVPNPVLAIDKVAAEIGYDEVGDVIHYTITATNIGNVTLHDVVVTDPNVSDLDCTPSLPVATLASGASITCTASHTVVQGDLDLGTFFNQACVDDNNGEGDGGAAEVCDDVTTPGQQTGGETDIPSFPTQPPTDGAPGGGSSGPADGAWLFIVILAIGLSALVIVTPSRHRKRT